MRVLETFLILFLLITGELRDGNSLSPKGGGRGWAWRRGRGWSEVVPLKPHKDTKYPYFSAELAKYE